MAKFHFVLLAILLAVSPCAAAKDTYYIGFIGNTNNATSNILYNALTLTADTFNSTNTSYAISTVFFQENDPNAGDSINNTGNLLGVIGVLNADNRALIEKVGEAPLISVASEYSGLNAGKRSNVFRMSASDAELAADTARFLVSVSQKDRFGIVYSNESGEYRDMAEAFQRAAERNHAKADYFKEVDPDRKDFEAVLLRLRDIKAKNIYFAGRASQAAMLARQSSAMNVGADFSSTRLIYAQSFVKASKAGGQGAVFASIEPSSIYGFKALRPFLKRYYELNKDDDMHIPYLYDAANMLIAGLLADKKSKSDMTKYLHAANYEGVTGDIYFNDGGERVVSPVYFYIIRGREFLQRSLRGAEAADYAKMK